MADKRTCVVCGKGFTTDSRKQNTDEPLCKDFLHRAAHLRASLKRYNRIVRDVNEQFSLRKPFAKLTIGGDEVKWDTPVKAKEEKTKEPTKAELKKMQDEVDKASVTIKK